METAALEFLALLLGAACAYGMMRAHVRRLVQDTERLSRQVDKTAEAIIHMDSVIQDVGRLRLQMDKTVELFREFELECRTRFAAEDARRLLQRKRSK